MELAINYDLNIHLYYSEKDKANYVGYDYIDFQYNTNKSQIMHFSDKDYEIFFDDTEFFWNQINGSCN